MSTPDSHPADLETADVQAAEPPRTGWATATAMMREYYDTEWGLPVTGERELFERLALEGFQAGLSWATVLSRREAFRRAFADFDPEAVAAFTEEDVDRLVQDASIIRSRAKIQAVITNARAVLALRAAAEAAEAASPEAGAGTGPTEATVLAEDPALTALVLPRAVGGELHIPAGLPALVWSHAPLRTPAPERAEDVPTRSAESEALAKELKRKGFRFIGPTSAYALMEACGLVDTHWTGSHRRGVSGVFDAEGNRAAFKRG